MVRKSSPFRRRSIQPGMWVVAEDGARLGRVFLIRESVMEVRPRRFSAEGFAVALDRIVGVDANEVRVRGAASEVRQPLDEAVQRQLIMHTLPLAVT